MHVKQVRHLRHLKHLHHVRDFRIRREKEEWAWAILGGIAALTAGAIANQTLKYGWRSVFKDDPPRNPIHPDISWGHALLWGGLAGMLMGTARIVGRRGAGEVWKRMRNTLPPGT